MYEVKACEGTLGGRRERTSLSGQTVRSMSFSHAHGTFANTDDVLGQKTCQIMEIIQNMFA